jgi:hypothetical protein
MSSEEIKYLSYEDALKIVGNVIEEEHLRETNRRILTVYDKSGKELCWYDAEEILNEVKGGKDIKDTDEIKEAAVSKIMRQIPEWVLDL